MKSENTFSFAPPVRWVRRSAVVLLGTLLVLLLHAPLRAGAQGCPSLDTGDFTATLIAANSDCHTPARLTVTYRNAVAGFSAMAYSVSKNRTNYSTPVVTPRPGLPAVLPQIVYHVKEAADVQATATITPAGGCEATGGAVSVHLSGVSGFSKAEFKLEKDGATPRHPSVPVGNLTARKPYEETLFFNLAPGRYTLRVRAVPDCVPATPGEGWKDGAYEWEQPVDVEHGHHDPHPRQLSGRCGHRRVESGGHRPPEIRIVEKGRHAHRHTALANGQCGLSGLRPHLHWIAPRRL